MTPLQAMKQALEALNKYAYYDTNKGYRCVACNTLHINSHLEWCPMLIAERNLRTAIEEMEKAEPVAWLYTYAGKPHAAGLKPRESWADHEQHPLYTHPAPIPEGWRDIAEEQPQEAQEVLFVRGGKTVHGAWIGGIFWHSNQKMAAAQWMPLPEPPKVGDGRTATKGHNDQAKGREHSERPA